MSNYDERNSAQIAMDELLQKTKTRLADMEFMSKKYKEDEEIYKQLKLIFGELTLLKTKIDNLSVEDGIHGKKSKRI